MTSLGLTPARGAALLVASAMTLGGLVVPVVGGISPGSSIRAVAGGAFVTAGYVTWSRGFRARIGWLFVAAGCCLCLVNLGLFHGEAAETLRLFTAGYAPFAAFLLHLLLVYPTGELHRRRERVFVAAFYGLIAAYIAAQVLVGDSAGRRFCAPDGCPHVFAPPLRSNLVAGLIGPVLALGLLTSVVVATVILGNRYRLASPAQRHHLRPVMVTLVGAAVMAVVVAVLRALAQPNGGTSRVIVGVALSISASVLGVVLLIGLLRMRFAVYGLGELVGQLGDDRPVEQVSVALAGLLDDPGVRLAFPAPAGGLVDAHGSSVSLPQPESGLGWVPVGEPPAAYLVHSSTLPPDPRLLQALAGAVRVLVRNAQLQEQLQKQVEELEASRVRIVTSADDERRRIERDLHDGAQQHLLGSALAVAAAQASLPDEPERASDLLALAGTQLQDAIDGLRALARGIHPAVLVESGIGAAVDSLAMRLPIAVDLDDRLVTREVAVLESTAYFVVCESVVNVMRHAGVEDVRVLLDSSDSDLVIEVSDRGLGGADAARGSGLRGLEDRVGALGGRLTVVSEPDVGTSVRAVIPRWRELR